MTARREVDRIERHRLAAARVRPSSRLRGWHPFSSDEAGEAGEVGRPLRAISAWLGSSIGGLSVFTDGMQCGTWFETDRLFSEIETLQFVFGEGPSIEAHASGLALQARLDQAGSRWPAFAAAALAQGAQTVTVLPLPAPCFGLGVLTFYGLQGGILSPVRLDEVQEAVDLVAELVMERLINTPPGLLPEPLDQTASKRTVVHTATGVVSEQLGVPVSQALDVLRAHSWAAEGDLYQIAAEVVGGTIRFEPQPASPEANQSA